MPAVSSVIAAVAAGVALTGSAVAYEAASSDARDNANDAKRQAAEQNAKLLQSQRDQVTKEENIASQTKMREQSMARQRALASKAQGRSGTILTSPLGVTGAAPNAAGGKTILGT